MKKEKKESLLILINLRADEDYVIIEEHSGSNPGVCVGVLQYNPVRENVEYDTLTLIT